MADEKFWRQQFDRKANWSLTWKLHAEDLLIAATVLDKAVQSAQATTNLKVGDVMPSQLRLGGPARLLQAAAIEALLRGRAVHRGHRFVVNGKFCPIPESGKGHDLVLLAHLTKFRLNDQQRDVLSRLSPSLELGRYPIGKAWHTGLKKHPHHGVGHVLATYWTSGDDRIIAGIVRRLRRHLR